MLTEQSHELDAKKPLRRRITEVTDIEWEVIDLRSEYVLEEMDQILMKVSLEEEISLSEGSSQREVMLSSWAFGIWRMGVYCLEEKLIWKIDIV